MTTKQQIPNKGITRWEKLGLVLLLIVMIISTLSTALASQQATKAAENTDVLSDCFKPDTSCSKLMLEGGIRTTAENKCLIGSLISIPPDRERLDKRVQILNDYELCVVYEIQQGKDALKRQAPIDKLKKQSK